MHFLNKSEAERWLCSEVGRVFAAVHVRVKDKTTLEMYVPSEKESCVTAVKADTVFAPLPDRMRVVDDKGRVVKPSKGSRFWVTVQSFDPCHLVTEAKTMPV